MVSLFSLEEWALLGGCTILMCWSIFFAGILFGGAIACLMCAVVMSQINDGTKK